MQTLNTYTKLYYNAISRICRLIISGFPINLSSAGGTTIGADLNTNYKPIKDMAFPVDDGQNIHVFADEYAIADITFVTDTAVTMNLDSQIEWTV